MHIILGGTSGLGWEMACQLRARGERVLVLGRTHEQVHGEGFALDLYDRTAVEWAIDELDDRAKNEAIQTFVWASGYGYRGKFADQEAVRSMGEVNFAGALPVVQWAWRRMLMQELSSTLVVISSTRGVEPRTENAVYVATKFAQVGFARSLGMETGDSGKHARVALFLPGGMKTPFWDGWVPNAEEYNTFNDPQKVAAKIIESVDRQEQHFIEVMIKPGSLL